VLARELSKAGARVEERADGLDLWPLEQPAEGEVKLDPADDHRMAMAFGILSLRVPGIRVLRPECVGKSFPGFWAALEQIRRGRSGAAQPAADGSGGPAAGARG
jgi:3-phosphoshikimate 1-carboxyvinyltransferase